MAKDGAKAVDEVSRQAMWAEVIKKENAMIGVPHKFFLNPSKLVFIARKPTEVDPRTYEADSFSTGNVLRDDRGKSLRQEALGLRSQALKTRWSPAAVATCVYAGGLVCFYVFPIRVACFLLSVVEAVCRYSRGSHRREERHLL